ncbi:plant intracellular Ras-group-related LRR protein 8-like [Papaver somniferum]|uniref:plant intracellular Ras-group-related LRR protein 8-like n=1 Tax=Papaver somniferum TaxID=3469 RepID=UPI000E6F8BD2|nr:plant intracellular Ras-group-related LRR protein 8-like [Papaver somniferum]
MRSNSLLLRRSLKLKVIPEKVWGCGSFLRVLVLFDLKGIDKLSSWCRLISNLLVDLPDTVGSLRNLEALHLSNNGLKSLLSMLFELCTQLSTLDLHNTEITIDILNQFEGWESFDERHRLKHQKQLDFRVGSSGEVLRRCFFLGREIL